LPKPTISFMGSLSSPGFQGTGLRDKKTLLILGPTPCLSTSS